MGALAYAATRHAPPALVDLGSKAERERLSASALKAFFAIAERWKLKDEEARALLGGPAASTFYEMKRAPEGRVLDQDRLTRLSYLIGIFKALHILHGEALADQWVGLPNGNRIFGGSTPLSYMIRGGAPAMQTVRRLLDARRGGL
ncbi:antitoxin Xre-like helix-turn-helix domain-containing protein [Paracraurococcus lichenis]|uniref:DUF2384 domain-containing protein n=1 Tax=Paracraurococcus lichenis TaxID=3064888 RepID=A0ABT9E2U4_9PROT|nr:antitoxin Xre-like helix-turn-helix domain-containing protein [Paracraurococcus sp. LOR1-02]MDO9710486.1 DUF2384 domain-containing protein [Paracraurococcus sp. LOR1-02]